jgi:hypothetical protein
MLFHRLFILDPTLLSFFKFSTSFDFHSLSKDFAAPNRDLFESEGFLNHARIVVGAIDMLVKNLRDLGKCLEILTELGERHKEYGITIPNYDALGVALINTLKAGLGDQFGGKEEESWTWLWGIIKATMTKMY